MTRALSFFILIVSVFASAPAQAHWGHVGELAGHGHLIAVGAAAAAAALAAALALSKPENDESGDEAELESDEGSLEGEGEPA